MSMDRVESEREDGHYYHDAETGISVFEKTKGETLRFCAWEGPVEDYLKATRTPWADSLEKALEFMDKRDFRCEKCGKTRSRKAGKRWSDVCKEGAHEWAAVPPKKKHMSGRKINIWFADSQLDEIGAVSDETGNDRASTIRDLVNLGLKFRRQFDNISSFADRLETERAAAPEEISRH